MRVICTAGHVDHGKTTLVAALTGQQPDRLAEEQARGLTIDLGFAWTDLPVAGTVAVVDLPGHERFVPNMLAGAGPVRAALLVVAADEGWMPQSEEHLAILELLEITHAVVALTRIDLVDDETAEIAAELVAERLATTPLAGARLVPVSAVTGAGMDDLRAALADLVAGLEPPEDAGRPRLWVDRSFSIRGAGTVVTGTLAGGVVQEGDTLQVQPSGAAVRVRGLQSLEQPVSRAHPGWRVALNLSGVAADEVGRGDAVVGGTWRSTTTVDAWCRPVGGGVLGRRGAWRVHVGTADVPARLYPLAGTDLAEAGPVRIELDRPLPLVVGDRLVLRESGRSVTVGGGVVLDPDPGPRPRGRAAREAILGAYADLPDLRDPSGRLSLVVTRREATPEVDALAMADATPAAVAATPRVEQVGTWLVQAEAWKVWARLAVTTVVGVHQRRPALPAVDPTHPRGLLRMSGCPEDLCDPLLARLVAEGRLERVRGGLAAPGHEPRLSVAQQQARLALLATLDSAGVEPPPLAEAAEAADADEDLLAVLTADGQLVPLPGGDAALSAGALAAAVEVLAALQAEGGPFTAAQARDALGTTRKHALPLLELLDARGTTTRDGDLRRLP